jgi:hypothetical protein
MLSNHNPAMNNFIYNHEYHQSMVYKVICAQKPDRVDITFEGVLDMIREIHKMARGIKQIVYLVGWQYDGHDSGYPAWFQVNERLKREADREAKDSLLWLMDEAKQFNAVVSLHINMCDAYKSSPLWDEYINSDLLIKNEDGTLAEGGFWDGEQAYLVSKTLEWRSGYAQKRIDSLLELLPISEAGTIHIDVFMPRASLFHGITYDDDIAAMIDILKYWKQKGVDVTTEWFHHEFAGKVPMVFHMNLDEEGRLKYPASIVCGGGSAWNMRHVRSYLDSPTPVFFKAPDAGCAYETAWGHTIDEDMEKDLRQFTEGFYIKTLPWLFLNRHKPLMHTNTADLYQVMFDEGILSSVRKKDGKHWLSQNGEVLVDGTDLCMPALWRENEYIAYSKNGCLKKWRLSGNWDDVHSIMLEPLSSGCEEPAREIPVSDGVVELKLDPGQTIVLKRNR